MSLPKSLQGRILDFQPVQLLDRNLWAAVIRDGEIIQIDLDDGSANALCRIDSPIPDLTQEVSLHLSQCGWMAAVVNTRGRQGIVIDLRNGKATMILDRGNYYIQHCKFPVAFWEVDGRLLLVHGSAWNRLDISDPRTGELLTNRSPTSYQRGEARPEHYLDYFHSGLAVSPGGDYIADNGWIWGPAGIISIWALKSWLRENPWESEDGHSKRGLCLRHYYWDGPLCWVGKGRLAVWGYGDDDENLIPAARIFDAASGREDHWFPGPKGTFVFDRWLFSFDAAEGMTVWDVASGERLLREEGFCPPRYHPGAKVFLTLRPDGLAQVSRLRGQPLEPSWLTADNGRVIQVARAIQADRDFAALPVLADALEEAGCRDEALLAHCRRPGQHGRNCWAIDWLLHGEVEGA